MRVGLCESYSTYQDNEFTSGDRLYSSVSSGWVYTDLWVVERELVSNDGGMFMTPERTGLVKQDV